MNVYTWREWQIKFKEQAGNDKQLQHELDCTGLVQFEVVQKRETITNNTIELQAKTVADGINHIRLLNAKMEAISRIIDEICPDCMTENDNSFECPNPKGCYIADIKTILKTSTNAADSKSEVKP